MTSSPPTVASGEGAGRAFDLGWRGRRIWPRPARASNTSPLALTASHLAGSGRRSAGSANRWTSRAVRCASGGAQRAARSSTPPRPTAGSWCRSPTSATRAPVSSAMVSRARAVSWSSIPASSTSSRSPRPQHARSVHRVGRSRGSSGRRRPSGSRAGGPARPPRTRGADLAGGDLGRLQGRGDHHQPAVLRRSSSVRAAARVVVLPAPAAPSTTSSRPCRSSAATSRRAGRRRAGVDCDHRRRWRPAARRGW